MAQSDDSETSELSFRLGTAKKQKLHEIALEHSEPGQQRVTASHVARLAVNQFLRCYDEDSCDVMTNGQLGVDPSDVDLLVEPVAEEP